MTRRRLVAVLVMLAMSLQGALAATRVCVSDAEAGTHAAPVAHVDAPSPHSHHAHAGLAPAPPGSSNAGAHDAARGVANAPAAPDDPHHAARGGDHASGSCSACAACCLAVALAPPVPSVALEPVASAVPRAAQAPIPRNVADALERPPRST